MQMVRGPVHATFPLNVNFIQLPRWARLVTRTGKLRNAYNILVGKPEGKSPLGRLRRRWKDIIRMDLREVWWEDVDCMLLALDRDQWWAPVNTVMNLRLP
jgi:hypothetical protein